MSLRLRLRPNEKVIINGCVVENGDRRNAIKVSSFGQIIRGKDILQPEDAVTRVQKLYFAIQMLLIRATPPADAIRLTNRLGSTAFISMTTDEGRARLLTAMERVHQGDFYKALVELRPFIHGGPDDNEAEAAADPDHLAEADLAFREVSLAGLESLEEEIAHEHH